MARLLRPFGALEGDGRTAFPSSRRAGTVPAGVTAPSSRTLGFPRHQRSRRRVPDSTGRPHVVYLPSP